MSGVEAIWRLVQLIMPALLGVLVAWRLGAKHPPSSLIHGLHIYAFYVAFPALIASGLLSAKVGLPEQWAFYLLWPLALGVVLALVRGWAPPKRRGELALVVCFGNVAYLGLPIVMGLSPERMHGAISLAVSVHVVFAVGLGPLLLARWASVEQVDEAQEGALWRARVRAILRQPLLWAPLVGLLGRALSPAWGQGALKLVAPIAGSAAPVALFMLGLYLFEARKSLRPSRSQGALLWSVSLRLVVAPGVVTVLGLAAMRLGWLDRELWRAHVLLAAMPAAITTFSMAREQGHGQETVAATIVWSTLLGPAAILGWAWLTGGGL